MYGSLNNNNNEDVYGSNMITDNVNGSNQPPPINQDGASLVYPEFISMSSVINKPQTSSQNNNPTSSNTYLNNMRKEMLSMVNNGTSTNNSGNSISISMDTSNGSININKSGYSMISSATSISENLNSGLLEKSDMMSGRIEIDMDDDLSPEHIKYNKIISSFAYLTFIGSALVLINEKKSIYIQFHAYQSFYISMGVIGLQLLFTWSKVISLLLWLFYILFIIFMFFKVFRGSYGKRYFFKLPVIGRLSENNAIFRSQEYSNFLKYNNDLLRLDIHRDKISRINQQQQQTNNSSVNSNNVGHHHHHHQRINSNTSSILMSNDVESILNSSDSGSNSSVAELENEIGTNTAEL